MAIFVGVSRSLSFLNDQPGKTRYWCVGGASRNARSGDQLLLYFPLNVSRAKNGIGQIYQIISSAQSLEQSPCDRFGMLEIKIQLLLNLEKHINMKDMKGDPLLQNWGAVRRSMQGVTFGISSELWPALRAMLIKANPQSDAILEPSVRIE